jgi:hypothetical protein
MYTGSKKSIAASVGASVTSAPRAHSRNTACKARGIRGPSLLADARRVEDMEELDVDVVRLGVVGGSLSAFGDFTGMESMEASTVFRGFRGVETAGESTVDLNPRRRLEGLTGEAAVQELAEEDRCPMYLGDLLGELENIFMLVSYQQSAC